MGSNFNEQFWFRNAMIGGWSAVAIIIGAILLNVNSESVIPLAIGTGFLIYFGAAIVRVIRNRG